MHCNSILTLEKSTSVGLIPYWLSSERYKDIMIRGSRLAVNASYLPSIVNRTRDAKFYRCLTDFLFCNFAHDQFGNLRNSRLLTFIRRRHRYRRIALVNCTCNSCYVNQNRSFARWVFMPSRITFVYNSKSICSRDRLCDS